MRTRHIPMSDWGPSLDQFSRIHHGQPATVESSAVDLGVQPNVRGLPLLGVTAEPRDPGPPEIQIMLGESPQTLVTHVVADPTRVHLAEWNDDVSATLQIESSDGTLTRVQVGPASETLPEGFITDGFYRRL